MSDRLLTVEQCSERLKLHPKTVLRFIREGRLRGSRVGRAYRILESDLNVFAGIAAGARPTQLQTRVTCVVEIEQVPAEACDRIVNLASAVLMSGGARPEPLHMTTAYDPQKQTLKAVLVGPPPDAAAWLQLLQAQLERMRE